MPHHPRRHQRTESWTLRGSIAVLATPSRKAVRKLAGRDPISVRCSFHRPTDFYVDPVLPTWVPDAEGRTLHLGVASLDGGADLVEGLSDEFGNVGRFDPVPSAENTLVIATRWRDPSAWAKGGRIRRLDIARRDGPIARQAFDTRG